MRNPNNGTTMLWQCPASACDRQHDNIKINSSFLLLSSLTSWIGISINIHTFIMITNRANIQFQDKSKWKQRLSIFSYRLICLSIVSGDDEVMRVTWGEWWLIRLSSPWCDHPGGDVWCHTLVHTSHSRTDIPSSACSLAWSRCRGHCSCQDIPPGCSADHSSH